MRIPKGKKITPEDHAEIAKFRAFLAAGKPQQQAYAERYGEVVFEAGADDKAPETD